MNFLPRNEKDIADANNESMPLILAVARDAGSLRAQLRFLKYLLSIVSIDIILLACAVAAVVASRVLQPLSTVAEQIENISEDNLKSRIAGENSPIEIAPIKKQLNSLLVRLEASFEREKTFNANVAHELRTSLAGIKSIIDVALARSRNAAEYHTALSESLSVINNMEEMVAKLLMLTRIENGQITFNKEQIKLAKLVDKCWRPFSEKTATAGIVFENHLSKSLIWESDSAALSMIFSNLLNNAAEYTNRNGSVWITAQKSNDDIEIIFENTGNQLTKQQLQDVFDCYWQGDTSRSSTGIHFGLGLALVKRIVELLGGKIRAESTNGLFSVRLYLPPT
jgi:two-component system heavy metal sensor histidine kinase CusS